MHLYKRLVFAVVLFLIILAGTSFFYSTVEGWNTLDSLYFTVATVTTIGYGDFVPQTNTGKIFAIFFPFIGIAMVFYFFSLMGKYVFRTTFERKLEEHHDKIIDHIHSTHKNHIDSMHKLRKNLDHKKGK